jgi:hypothetical protein
MRAKSYLFSSLFGAVMIAATYGYFHYKFSKFHFIDFSKSLFYTSDSIFTPKEKNYTVVFFSSKKNKVGIILNKIKTNHKILIIDICGKKYTSSKNVIFLRTNINTLLPIINNFRINEVPIAFNMVKISNQNYKQSTKFYKILR